MSGQKVLRLVIVDDEPPARDLLAQYLEERSDVEVVAACANGFEAVKAVEELKPDIVLLDIQMPKLDGFEVLELLDHRPQVIFTTAYDEYGPQAFEVEAVDYLLKPIAPERLGQALDRARARIDAGESQPLDRISRDLMTDDTKRRRVLVREGARVHVLQSGDIDYVEAQDDYVVLCCGGKTFRKKQTLTDLESRLGDEFVRIHRSYLLNVDRLHRIEPYARDSRVAFLTDGKRLPVSRAGYDRLRRLL